MPVVDVLTDSLLRDDPKSQELAYNNRTDRMKIELPPAGDPASSGCVTIKYISPLDQPRVNKRLTYNAHNDVATIKTADAAAASGSPCLLQTLSYDSSYNVEYIVESLSTW